MEAEAVEEHGWLACFSRIPHPTFLYRPQWTEPSHTNHQSKKKKKKKKRDSDLPAENWFSYLKFFFLDDSRSWHIEKKQNKTKH